jgi:predicted outer membrane protein
MQCHELSQRIESMQPGAAPRDVARLCLVLANEVGQFDKLADDKQLRTAWREASLKLQAATDQHQAMTEELESLAASDPKKFTPEQIWVLIRAIKVQSQILQLYVGEALVDV